MEHGHVEGAHVEGGSKRIGLLIAVLALCLALVETGAKSTQTQAISTTVATNDLWAFYQARTVRQTVVTTAADLAELEKQATADAGLRTAIETQQKKWRGMAAKWSDDPKGDGRKQLMAKARNTEAERENWYAKYHMYEYSAAAFQVAIVVVSASVVVGFPLLAAGGVLVALVGGVLGLLGLLAPHLLQL